MEASIQLLAAISFLVIGVSHVLQPKAWAGIFIRLREAGNAGVMCIALLTLPMGVLIVSFHNVWSGAPVVLTVVGWGYCAKGFVYLAWPRVGLNMLAKVSMDRAGGFVIAGVGLIALSGLCWWLRFGASG